MVRGVALAACGVAAGVQGGQGVRSCAVTLSDAQNGRRAARGGQRHPPPPGTLSQPPQGRRSGTRCRRWCGATLDTLTPRTAPQTLRRPRQTVQGHSYPPTAPREPQPPRMTRRGCATHLYEYRDMAQPQSRKPE